MKHDPFKTLKSFKIGQQKGQFYSLPALGKTLGLNISQLPVSIRIVLESVLRHCDGKKSLSSTSKPRAMATECQARG